MKRILSALLIALLLLPACALAVSFEITDYAMDVQVEPDGAAAFDESIVYAFDGEYNGMLMTIRYEGDAVPDGLRILVDGDTELTRVAALEGTPNTYVAEAENGKLSIRAYTPGSDDTRAYRVLYRKADFAKRYEDSAYIDQTLLIPESVYQRAAFRLALPGPADEVAELLVSGTAFSDYTVRDGVISFAPRRVSEGENIFVRVPFPAEWLPDAPVIPTRLADVLAARQAEEQAAREQAEAQRRTAQYTLLTALAVYVVLFFFSFRKQMKAYGLRRRVDPVTDNALLDGTPVAVAQLLKQKVVSASAFTASLMELAGMGVLTMRTDADKGDTCFTLADAGAKKDTLWRHQAELIAWLFDGTGELWMASLDAGGDERAAKTFNQKYNEWKNRVRADTVEAGWLFANGTKRFLLAFLSLALGVLLALSLFGLSGTELPALLAAIAAIAFCVGFARLRRLSDEGERRVAALDGFLENYGDVLARDPGVIIGRAPLAMALSYMKPLADWIDSNSELSDDAFPGGSPPWVYVGWHHAAMSMERTARDAQNHNAGVEQGDMGSAGGGGSTGGGGGSSHGAW